MKLNRIFVILLSLLLRHSVAVAETVPRDFDFLQMKRGGQLFQQHCATCHGKNAEGAKNWQQRDVAGKMPAPPLNGAGHAWHHPTAVLMDVIKNGTQRIGGNMPPWKDKLKDEEIRDILAWLQAKWSDEIYAAWYRNEMNATK